jgi:PIN domain nuclease of toxin-antitoxin system
VILLDTHVLAWAVADPKRLSRAASQSIKRARGEQGIAISAITLWELAQLFGRRKIQGHGTVDSSLRLFIEGVIVQPITPEIAVLATEFPASYPGDPCDRIIGATARAGEMILITRDENIRKSPLIRTLW